MIRLVRVEVRRILARRIPVLAVLAALAVSLMALFGVHQMAVSVNQQRAMAHELLDEFAASWEPAPLEEYQACVRDQARARQDPGQGDVDYGCEQLRRAPVLEDFIQDLPSMTEQYRELLGYLALPFLFLPLAVGSTSVAAEFAHRTMGAWLTFVPRRVPVLFAKVLAAALLAVPVVGTGLTVILLGVPALFRHHGIDDGVTGAEWVSLAWMALRVLGLGLAAGAFGAAAAFVLRHSGLVIGMMVGYLVLVEGLLASFYPSSGRWLLGNNIQAVVEHGTRWLTWPTFCDDVTVSCDPVVHEISLTHGVVVLLVVLVAVLGLALLRFVRSDVE